MSRELDLEDFRGWIQDPVSNPENENQVQKGEAKKKKKKKTGKGKVWGTLRLTSDRIANPLGVKTLKRIPSVIETRKSND